VRRARGRPGEAAHRLGLKQLTEDPWLDAIPTRYRPGMIVKGKVTKITNFGVFVELETGLEGLLHISSWPTTRSRTRRTWSRSATRSRSRSCASTPTSARSASRSSGAGPDETERNATGGAAREPREGRAAPARGGMDDHGAMGTDKIRF
jgi:small subunit ribosomal protein S1